MKFLIVMMLVLSCTNDAQKIKEAETTGMPVTESTNSIVEENDSCICTKDFRPVCGSNGQEYPNACQAECDGVNEYSEGSC